MKPAQTVAVGELDGMVVLHLPVVTDTITLDPETARDMGECMAKEAYKIRYGVKDMSKSVISEEVRKRLIRRAELIMVSEKNKKPEWIATSIVDSILAEVSG